MASETPTPGGSNGTPVDPPKSASSTDDIVPVVPPAFVDAADTSTMASDLPAVNSAVPPEVSKAPTAEPRNSDLTFAGNVPPTILDTVEVPPVVDVSDLPWQAVRDAVDPAAIRGRIRSVVEAMETLLDSAGGPGMLFDADRTDASDRAIRIEAFDSSSPLWIIGDIHGDLLTLEASLSFIRASSLEGARSRIVFLGDLFDDGGFGLEVLLRVFELIVEAPELICVIAGNHDEALSYDGARFSSSVSPCDFTDLLNANLAHEWIGRTGKLAVRLFAGAPRALFFPDGLLISHGGFPLVDLHARLAETGNWNDPACLADFVWTRAHEKARKKIPNRYARGAQYGYEDFAAFCGLTERLGRKVTHIVRGHDHVEQRYAIYPAYRPFPILTTVALARRLNRESFGPYTRVPTLARFVEGALPQVYRLHIPSDMIRDVYPEPLPDSSDAMEPGVERSI